MGKFNRDSYRRMFKQRPPTLDLQKVRQHYPRKRPLDEAVDVFVSGSPLSFCVPVDACIGEGGDKFGLSREDLGIYIKLCILSVSASIPTPMGEMKRLSCVVVSTQSLSTIEVRDER